MIVREAVPDDYEAAAQVLRAAYVNIGLAPPAESTVFDRISVLQSKRVRMWVVYDGVLAGALGAVLGSFDGNPGYDVVLWGADPDHPDPIKAADALAMHCASVVSAEGAKTVTVFRGFAKPVTSLDPLWLYARDALGMVVTDIGRIPETGDVGGYWLKGWPATMIANILKRRPEWRQSLTFMT